MAEQKFDPVKEFVNLRDSIGKAVEQSLRGMTGSSYPALDMYETAEAVFVRAAFITGLDPHSVEVSMEGEVLTISGQAEDPLDVNEATFLQRELQFGAFSRAVRIPRKVDANQASASIKKGVMTITLPKVQGKKPHIINITPAE